LSEEQGMTSNLKISGFRYIKRPYRYIPNMIVESYETFVVDNESEDS
jgi:hypothetical protein